MEECSVLLKCKALCKNTMKALFIGSYPNPVEPFRSIFFRELIYEMAKQGIECTVISCVSITSYRCQIYKIPQYSVEILETGEKIEVYRPYIISYSAKNVGKWNTIHLTQKSIEHAVLKLLKQINKKFDFVYGHFFLGGGLTAAKVSQKYNIPAYIAYGECNFETEVSNKYGMITVSEMRGVKGIIAVSSCNKKDIENRAFSKGIPVLLSINSINNDVFYKKDKKKCREILGMPPNDFIVGFVGYFIERKGPERVMDACSNLSGVKLAFAGKGNNKPNGDNVVFCKSLAHDQVADFLNAVDVFVLPTKNEGCCNAVVEAMACGKAIISSDLPFNYDVLNPSNAILIDPMDINAIRKAIIRLRDNSMVRESLATKALEDASKFTIKHRVEKIIQFVNETK